MTTLVIGPSHAGGFRRMINGHSSSINEIVHFAGIHGAAFTTGELFKEIGKGVIKLQKGIDISGRNFRWFTSVGLDSD